MKLVRWRPARDLYDLRSDMDRLFSSWMRDFPVAGGESQAWLPAADVREVSEGFDIHLDLPGIQNQDVKVSVFGDTVTVRGERKDLVKQEDENWHRVERFVGAFERTFRLGTALDAAKVTAHYKDGVLQITVPKAESAKPKEIDVQVSG
jgi:HSP20 family protein